jgi:transposase-like protein
MKRKGPERDPERERFWRRTIRQQQQSGRSVREYCRGHDVSEASFYAWRREITRRGGQRTGKVAGRRRKAAAFVPVRIVASAASIGGASIECLLPSGVLLRLPAGMEPAAVAAVVCAWERSRC